MKSSIHYFLVLLSAYNIIIVFQTWPYKLVIISALNKIFSSLNFLVILQIRIRMNIREMVRKPHIKGRIFNQQISFQTTSPMTVPVSSRNHSLQELVAIKNFKSKHWKKISTRIFKKLHSIVLCKAFTPPLNYGFLCLHNSRVYSAN